MFRCYVCRERLYADREKLGARCPRCREPLYEPPRDPARPIEGQVVDAHCVVHAGNPSVGTCQRCGNFLCAVCRTRWREKVICSDCVGRALEAQETPPEEARAHLRQGILALIFGIVAWAITLLAVVCMAMGMAEGDIKPMLVGIGVLILLVSPLPALLGVGQGAAAIRSRGDHMILATFGLILSGLHVGVVVGIFTVSIVVNG
jgi:hypothetical protein